MSPSTIFKWYFSITGLPGKVPETSAVKTPPVPFSTKPIGFITVLYFLFASAIQCSISILPLCVLPSSTTTAVQRNNLHKQYCQSCFEILLILLLLLENSSRSYFELLNCWYGSTVNYEFGSCQIPGSWRN